MRPRPSARPSSPGAAPRRPAPGSRAGRHSPARTRRSAAATRRSRLALAVAVLVSGAIVGAWFPVSALLHQREQLAAAAAQLGKLDEQNATLRHQEKQLRTRSTLGRIAQGQYDLVPPGDQAYQVLPPSGSGNSDGTLTPTRTPAKARGSHASRTPGEAGGSSGQTGSATTGSFFGRVLETLEFWR